MNVQDIHNQVKQMRANSFKDTPQITLGELLDQLKDIPTEWGSDKEPVSIEFDFGTAMPQGFSSWRGSYDEVAINYDLGGYDNNNADQFKHMDLKEFVKELEETIGKTFTGWKGGDFRMTRDTPVWVANDGNVGNTGVIGVLNNNYKVVILTAYCEF